MRPSGSAAPPSCLGWSASWTPCERRGEMRILMWGRGHPGTLSAVGFAAMGHHVTGIDRDGRIVDAFLAGRALIRESGVDPLLRDLLSSGRLHASTSDRGLVAEADVVLVCVGTASPNGDILSSDELLDAARELGAGLRDAPPDRKSVV